MGVPLFQKGTVKTFLRKASKTAGSVGNILTKGSQVLQKGLNAVSEVDPALAATPYLAGAQTLVGGAAIAGKALTGLSQAKNVDQGISSLKDAYTEAKNNNRLPGQGQPQDPGPTTASMA
jgi:hypothetical protein